MADGTVSVRLPDGRIVKNVPKGTSQKDLLAKVGGFFQESPPTIGGAETFAREATGGFLDHIKKLPATALNYAAGGIIGANPLIDSDTRDAAKVAMGLHLRDKTLPLPDSNNLFAGVQKAVETGASIANPSGPSPVTFADAQANQQQLTDMGREQHPFAAAGGEVAGDVAMMGVLRNPVAGQRGRENLAARVVADTAKSAEKTGKGLASSASVKEWLKGIGLNAQNSSMANSAGRVIEAGVEGQALAILKENDPVQAAQYAAGTQLAGNIVLSGWNGIFSGSKLGAAGKLALATGGLWAALQVGSSLTPGGSNSPIENVRTAASKIGWGLTAGVLAGLGGSGRVTGVLPVNVMPAAADYITSIPRSAMQSAMQDMVTDPETSSVMNTILNNPNAFNPAVARRIERAITTDNVSLKGTIEGLLKDRQFSRKLEELQ